MRITSRDNRYVKEVRRLLADAKYRRESGRFAIEGVRLCRDAVRSGVKVEVFLYTPKAARQYAEALEEMGTACGGGMEIAEELSDYMADTAAPQGVYGICRVLDNRPACDTMKTTGRLLGLEDIQDPANLGAVIRTAEALGLEGLLLSTGCCDPYNPKVLRASMAAFSASRCIRWGRWRPRWSGSAWRAAAASPACPTGKRPPSAPSSGGRRTSV